MSRKCIAAQYGNCSDDLSGEHYVSRSILDLFSQGKSAEVMGLPWIEEGRFQKVGINSLTSNIFCSYHNTLLSPLDAEAAKLFSVFDEIDRSLAIPDSIASQTYNINGDKIEQWMLKNCVGMIASKQISHGQTRVDLSMKQTYLDILFRSASFPAGWGTYFSIPETGVIHKFNGFSYLPLIHGNELKAAQYWIQNFVFYLCLGKPDNPEAWGVSHPEAIRFEFLNKSRSIEFSWSVPNPGSVVQLKRIASTDAIPDNWKKYLE